jgi:hypothetical protein
MWQRYLFLLLLTGVAAIPTLTGARRPAATEAQSIGAETAPASIDVQQLKRIEIASRVEGTASVLSTDPLLQLDADIRSAKLAAKFSANVFQRASQLNSSSVAISKQAFEAAQRQSESDAVQVKLLENRLTQAWGNEAPFLDESNRQKLVSRLSSGELALVRADIPGGDPGPLKEFSLSPLGGGAPTGVLRFWPAPAGNLSMPGSSYFALATAGPGLRAGDRATVSAIRDHANSGFLVPRSALVIADGEAWCFVGKGVPAKFSRRPLPLDAPLIDGYLVNEGFAEDDMVVVRGAAMLLAQEAQHLDGDEPTK